MRVRLLKKAEADLDDIWDFIALDDPVAAGQMIKTILKGLETLGVFPMAGRERDDLDAGVRSWSVATPYVVFYVIGKREVQVVRILHGSRDLPRIFG